MSGRPRVSLTTRPVTDPKTSSTTLFAENGSAHIDCLCKWGTSTYTERRRVLPSGRPHETVETKPQGDPTWELEYQHFLQLCQNPQNNIANDIWIDSVLKELGKQSPP